MFKPRRIKPFLFALAIASAQAGLLSAKVKPARVGGKWRIAWDVRLGTVRGILDLKQSANQVTGTFEEYGQTYSLSGTIAGNAITFDIPFTGLRPYTIEFKGTVERDKMTGTSALKGEGRAFLGHAGEVDEPQRPWNATKGLKRPNNTPDKRPDDDDDDDRHR
jgi:hypothetical protein